MHDYSLGKAFDMGGKLFITHILRFILLHIIWIAGFIIFAGVLMASTVVIGGQTETQTMTVAEAIEDGHINAFDDEYIFPENQEIAVEVEIVNKTGLAVFILIVWVALSVMSVLELGIQKYMLQLIDEEQSSLTVILSEFKRTHLYLGLFTILGIATFVGLILFVIPGFVFAFLMRYAPIIMADQQTGIFDSMKKSFDITTQNFLSILLLVFVLGIFIQIGYWFLLVGALITVPMSVLIDLIGYRSFQEYVPEDTV